MIIKIQRYFVYPDLKRQTPNQINKLELQKPGNNTLQKELFSFKGGDEYFDNYPFSVKLNKEFNKIIRIVFK